MTEQTSRFKHLRLQRLTPLSQSDFFQNIVAALGSRGIVIALGLATSIFFARALGPEGRGQLGITNAITAMGVQLGLLGFHQANTFHVSKNPSLLPVMVANSLLISACVGGVTMALLFSCRFLILGDTPLPLPLMLFSLFNIPLNICFLQFSGLLRGIQNFKANNFNEILHKALITLLILTFILLGTISVKSAILFQGFSLIVCVAMMLRTLLKSMDKIKGPSFSLLKENFFYGGKAYLASFFAWGITRVDLFILQRSQSLEQVGYFSVALSIIDIFLILSTVVAGILHPKLCVESDIRKKWALTKNTAFGLTAIILLVALTTMIWKAPILWVYGAQFAPLPHSPVLPSPWFYFLINFASFDSIHHLNSISLASRHPLGNCARSQVCN